jgi:hypothetical protein
VVFNTLSPQSSLDPEAIASLRSHVQGSVYLPGDAGYDDGVGAWAAHAKHSPDIVVMPESDQDVARAVAFAHRFDLPVAVQGTGHGVPRSADEGVFINTSRMQGISIDPERRLARAEAGVTWESLIPRAAEYGLAPLSGSSSTVGVVGYILGGGYGWLTRKYGRAADRVVSADVVTADGELLNVTADAHPDLFWAIRGGGGNFGVVTALEFDLVEVAQVFGGSVMYPLEDAPRVFEAYSQWTASVTDDITSSIGILRMPPVPALPPPLRGAQLVVVRACASGDLHAGEAAIAPMRLLGTPVMDTFSAMPFTETDAISMDPKESMPALGTTMMLQDLDVAVVDALLGQVGAGVDSPLLSIEIRDYRRTSVEDAAPGAGSRYGLSMFAIGPVMNDKGKAAVDGALSRLREALRPYATRDVLLNFLGEGDVGPDRTRAAYPEKDFARLQQLKHQYDPQNRFRFNHNIAPE